MTEQLQHFVDVVASTWVFISIVLAVAAGWVIYELKVQLTAANKFIDLVLTELNADKDTQPANPGIVALPPRRENSRG